MDRLVERSRGRVVQPDAPRPPIQVPLLGIRIDGQLELFDESAFLECEWDLAACDAELSEAEFPSQARASVAGEVGVTEEGKLYTAADADQLHQQLTMVGFESGWSLPALVNWLDRRIPHPDIPQTQSSLFIHNALTGLTEGRGLGIEQLARAKFRLCDAVETRIAAHRDAQCRRAFQSVLFGPDAPRVEVSPKLVLTLDEDHYAPNWYYEGPHRFRKHLFPRVGELKEGEEFDCACFLDEQLPEVECWARNIERRPDTSFWLQTATDRFYPDFIVRLHDGRILVVEYKGEDRWSTDDSKEKRAVGELWADRSAGHCMFVLPKGPDYTAIRQVASHRA